MSEMSDLRVERKDTREAAWDAVEVFTDRQDARLFLRRYVMARPLPRVGRDSGSYYDPDHQGRVRVRIREVSGGRP